MENQTEERRDLRRPTGREWQRKHRLVLERAQRVAKALREHGHEAAAFKVERCGHYEELVCCAQCGAHWYEIEHCDLRVCPVCAQRVAIARSRKIEALAATAKAPKMLTLTMRHWTGNPREGIKHLREGINDLRKRDIMRTCKAGAYCVELVRKPDGWHIHAHVIVDADYIPQKRLIGAWSAAIRVRGAHVRVQGATAKAVQRYICKYASKAGVDEQADNEVVEWFEAVQGSRLWATWGEWYGPKARTITDKAAQERPQSKCPVCGSLSCVFPARAGEKIWGEAWKAVMRFFVGENEFHRKIIGSVDEAEPEEAAVWYSPEVEALWA